MPVEDVQFYSRHCVQIAPDHFQRHEVARRIEHEAAPREPRLIFNVDRTGFEPIAAEYDKLCERFEPVQRPGAGWRLDGGALGSDVEGVRLVFTEHGILAAGRCAFYSQSGRRV